MIARKFSKRLASLEAVLIPKGCPACQDRRGRVIIVEPHKGDVEPTSCLICGKIPEFIIEIVAPAEAAAHKHKCT